MCVTILHKVAGQQQSRASNAKPSLTSGILVSAAAAGVDVLAVVGPLVEAVVEAVAVGVVGAAAEEEEEEVGLLGGPEGPGQPTPGAMMSYA